MGARPQTHRSSTLARRRALLEAAVALVAEHGVGGVTHRGVAARAGLPTATTSYFFESLDELVLEAMRVLAAEEVEALDAIARAVASLTPDEVLDRFVGALLAQPAARNVAQFEAYLEVTRRPELREEVGAVLVAFERLAEAALRAAGAARPAEGARAFVALADGFALHRLAHPRGGADAEALRAGFGALFSAYAERA
jgi:DNA-binding transcriptional regulator YbjK